MARVLLAWEFGGDLGHMMRVLAIAHELRDRGHEPLLAFADLGALGALDSSGLPAVPAPLLPRPPEIDPSPLNASDILLNLGYGDPAGLAGALAGWSGLLRLFDPRVVVADYAPTALLAAKTAGLPRISIGSGFSVPPRGDPMPALRSWIASDPRVLAQRDARLVAATREALARVAPRAQPPTSAASIFEADTNLVCSWPALDPFGPRDDVEYLGPQGGGAAMLPVSWQTSARPRVFAYLKPRDPRFAELVRVMAAVAGEGLVAAPGLREEEAHAMSTATVRVIARPVGLGAIVADLDLCIGHAGSGVSGAALAAGVAQALLPMHLEQHLVARRLSKAGVARVLDADARAPDLAAWLLEALGDARLHAAARAARAAAEPNASAAARIARVLET